MVSAPVTGKDSLLVNFKQNISKEHVGSDSFSKLMEKSPSNEHVQKPLKGKVQVEKIEKKIPQEQKITKSKPEEYGQENQPIEALDEASQKVVEAVAKELGISVEEVMNALQNLKLTPMDLLQVNHMGNLLVELSGDGDMLNLLTNEEMFQSLKQLNELVNTTVEELKETFSLTDVEFNQLLQEGKTLSKVQSTEVLKPLNEPEDVMNLVVTEENTKSKEIPVSTLVGTENKGEVPMDSKTEAGILTTKGADANVSGLETNKIEVQVEKVETNKDHSSQQAPDPEDGPEDGENEQEQPGFYQNIMGKASTSQIVKTETQLPNQSPDTENIMKQIMDYMKIQVKADATQMELQLHPSSLGTINVQISSKEGVITAQFIAQNEGVKTALEGQIVQLKENFNEQGLKVEAVEVTVASHQFERNMNQGKQDATNAQAAKKKGIRRIDLEQLNRLEEDGLEEADMITADMMIKNGNTVDYTA